ncbi:MAG: hypothetical protein CL685_00495 [Candidatus Magasanikbacteria bacterium]|nr:hypothetical protein [Candidatus Magasanikbacteria bacterium]
MFAWPINSQTYFVIKFLDTPNYIFCYKIPYETIQNTIICVQLWETGGFCIVSFIQQTAYLLTNCGLTCG